MNGRSKIQPQLTTRSAGLHRLWNIEALEQRLLLSGVADAFGVRKIKYLDADGDKVQIKLSGKGDSFDVTFNHDLMGNVTGVNTLTLHGTNPSAQLNFDVKAAKGGLSDKTAFVDSIASGVADPNFSLSGINANNTQITSINLSGSIGNQQSASQFSGSLVTNRDLGSVTTGNILANITIQGAHNLTGNVSASQIGKVNVSGGDILGSISTTSGIGTLLSIQADDMSGNVTAAGGFAKLTLTGDLSGDVSFGKGTLVVLIGGDLTSAGSITGNDPSANLANVDAGGFTRIGIVGNVAGLLSAEGTLGLGVGGSLQGSASVSAGGDLTVKANSMTSNLVTLASTGSDVYFAMNTGGFAGTINSADDVFGNGSNGSIVIRGGNFSGVINATGDVAAMTFSPTSGGFSGDIVAGGVVNDITTNFFASTASVTGASLGNLTANRGNSGDAIALGATFHATGLVGGNIGNVTATAIGSIAIGGTFISDHGNIGNVIATSNGNASGDHAIGGATFTATAGSIGTVTASAKAGHGISDSTFTAATGIDDMSASSITGDGFHASAAGKNLFTVTNGSLANITGTSVSGDGIHGGTFTASQDIADVKGTSANGSGIGDESGGVTTTFTATTGSIVALIGRATGGVTGSGGDGIVNTVATANQDANTMGIGNISGRSQFGNGVVNSTFSAEGSIGAIFGETKNSDPSVNKDGISNSVFRTAANIGNVIANSAVVGGAGIGSAIEGSTFSAGGSFAHTSFGGGSDLFANGDVFAAIGNGAVQWRHGDGTLVATLVSGVAGNINTTGMAFDGSGNLYNTMFDSQTVSVFAPDGSFVGTFGSGYSLNPESILIDSSGNVYVGQADGTRQILKFDSTGNLLAAYSPETEDRGTDWIDLAPDQHTIYYTSEDLDILRFDTETGTQLANFNSSPLPGSHAYALRILTSGGVLVADSESIVQLSSSGNVIQSYDATGQDTWFALNLDPDGTSFWSADLFTGDIYKFDIATGSVLLHFNTGAPANSQGAFIGGLAVKGEITSSTLGASLIATNGDVKDSRFLAGYDIGPNLILNGTNGDAQEVAAITPVTSGSISVTGDWVNSFVAAGINTTDSTIGNGDDTLSAPGSSIGNVAITSNIAGITGGVASNNFQSDSIGKISADAIGIDPNSGSSAAAVEVSTNFSNGILGTIGDVTANTSTQRQAIGDGTIFHAGTSIASVTAINDNTSFNTLNAIGSATFEAGTFIGDITASTQFATSGATLQNTSFTAHANSVESGLAIGNLKVTSGLPGASDPIAINSSEFDASAPTVVGTALNIGTIEVLGNIGLTDFTATGDIARGVRFTTPNFVTTADLNADGNLDLIVLNQGSDTVAVSLGNGDGTFQKPTFYAAGANPVKAVVVDLNADTSLDLVVLNDVTDPAENDTISELVNNGDGTFAIATSVDIGFAGTPTGIAMGDWIEDGVADLAITDSASGHVAIFKGIGDGDFISVGSFTSTLTAGSTPSALVITATTGHPSAPPTSFNGDGHIDMAVVNKDSNNVSVFLGDVGQSPVGSGTWSAATNFAVDNGPVALAIGSLDSTLNISLDIVTANQFSDTVSVLLGTGTGSFGAATSYAVGNDPLGVSVVDVNHDGKLDIVTVNSGSNNVSVLLGNGLGAFGAATHFAAGQNPVSLATGDFDKDGNVDFVTTNQDSGSLTVLFGDGAGNFELRNIYTDPSIIGIQVTGNIGYRELYYNGAVLGNNFISDFDLNGTGAVAGIGGIHVLPGFSSSLASVQGTVFASNFVGGSNDDTSGVAIGDVKIEGSDTVFLMVIYRYAIDSDSFITGSGADLNLGTLTATAGSTGTGSAADVVLTSATHSSATGDIHDINIAADISSDTAFLADSDGDLSGDIQSVTAGAISGGIFTANNVAVSDADTTRAITVVSGVSGLNVTTTTGDIGDFLVSQDVGNITGVGVTNVVFSSARDIGKISVTYTKPAEEGSTDIIVIADVFTGNEITAGRVDATGKIDDITVSNIITINDGTMITGSHFQSGSGGIGDIIAKTVGLGSGIVDSVFRAAGTVDASHLATIGNITVVTVNLEGNVPNEGVVGSTFSALGSIGVGAGNANNLNVDIIGNVRNSMFLAGYDVGADLAFNGNIGSSDDTLATAVTFINKVSITGQFFGSDMIAGVDPGDDHFGNADDVSAVLGSSVGSIFLGGVVDPTVVGNAGKGGVISENPLTDRLHAIEADLLGSLKVGIDDNQEISALPGYLDNGGGAEDVNLRVL